MNILYLFRFPLPLFPPSTGRVRSMCFPPPGGRGDRLPWIAGPRGGGFPPPDLLSGFFATDVSPILLPSATAQDFRYISYRPPRSMSDDLSPVSELSPKTCLNDAVCIISVDHANIILTNSPEDLVQRRLADDVLGKDILDPS
jgi:hypothetical protein